MRALIGNELRLRRARRERISSYETVLRRDVLDVVFRLAVANCVSHGLRVFSYYVHYRNACFHISQGLKFK